jgi:four helix bundle protein
VADASQKDQIKTFEDLDVWKVCQKLRREIAELARTFPKEEQYRLSDQIIRASRSVTANIAEGYGRFYYQENVQFCRQARGSLYEVLDHLTVACDASYITEDSFRTHRDEVIRCIVVLNGYLRYLKNARSTVESIV